MENLKSLKQWVVWKFERRGGQMTKIPYMTNGTTASSTNADTWALYNDVKSKSKYFSGIGLVLTKESNILFIDLDKCLDDLPPEFRQLIDSANTYTEVSPSGTGLHLLLRVSGDFNLNANRSKKMPHFEVYNTGRYATITEAYFESRTDIRTVTPEEATSILSIVGYPWKETYEKISTHKKSSFSLTTNDVLERMFASKNGRDIKELYNGDILKYNDDESSADMALCMHLAFWFQKDKEKIREAWTLSPLGNRKKTQERIDYQERTLNACIEKTNDVYTSPEEVIKQTTGEYLQLQKNDKGVPFVNVTNLAYIISIDPFLKSSFRYNDFFKIEETSLSKNNKWVGFDKQHTIEVMIHIQKNYPYFERTALALVEQAILNSTHNNVVNEPKQYIESLEWDGEHRLNHWLSLTYGTPDDTYHSAVGANWLKGLVQRVVEPGCKFDYVLVLEGEQGYRKTTSMHILGRGFHVETALSSDNKDFYMLLLRNIIVEFSEGETLSRSEIKNLKAVLTMQEDQFRLPYGRAMATYPRHCVFAMTTNQDQYLKDETGNRRWLPVEVRMVADTAWLEKNLEQLYAEAYHRVIHLRETTYEFPIEETLLKQKNRVMDDPYQEEVISWYLNLAREKQEDGITTLQVYQQVHQQGSSLGREMPRAQAMVIASMLRNALFLDKKRTMTGGERNNRWYPTEKTMALMGDLIELDNSRIW